MQQDLPLRLLSRLASALLLAGVLILGGFQTIGPSICNGELRVTFGSIQRGPGEPALRGAWRREIADTPWVHLQSNAPGVKRADTNPSCC